MGLVVLAAMAEGRPVKGVPGSLAVLALGLIVALIGWGAAFQTARFAKGFGDGRELVERKMKWRVLTIRVTGIWFLLGGSVFVVAACRLLVNSLR